IAGRLAQLELLLGGLGDVPGRRLDARRRRLDALDEPPDLGLAALHGHEEEDAERDHRSVDRREAQPQLASDCHLTQRRPGRRHPAHLHRVPLRAGRCDIPRPDAGRPPAIRAGLPSRRSWPGMGARAPIPARTYCPIGLKTWIRLLPVSTTYT